MTEFAYVDSLICTCHMCRMGQGSVDMMMALVIKRDNAGNEESTCQMVSVE